MQKTFLKMHGLGNDFVIFDGRAGAPLYLSTEMIRSLGDRHTGVGFDQMVIISPPKSAQADVFMSIFNSDGSEVGACGNATRCVADVLMRETGRSEAALETMAGILKARRAGAGRVCVDMGKVRLGWQDIPLSEEQDTLSLGLSEGMLKAPVAVNVGNPHAVFFVQQLEEVPLEKFGPLIENHPLFPEKTNVEVVRIDSWNALTMQVWERGVGITRACGTGACAAAVAAARRGLTGRKVSVTLEGGVLDIEWREADDHVLMTGAVEEVFTGTLSQGFGE
ncbi:MAG: diaminopimelate epimerase [Alphaproteobacteria bacterium]|nr:diaminopimelate epimerase [Alphaproteobacteria bacterium]